MDVRVDEAGDEGAAPKVVRLNPDSRQFSKSRQRADRLNHASADKERLAAAASLPRRGAHRARGAARVEKCPTVK